MATFTGDLLAYASKTSGNLDKIFRATCLAILRDVVMLTPVDTGRAKGNWQVTINVPAQGVLDFEDPTGVGAIAKATTFLATLEAGTTFVLTNNLEYILYLEDGTAKIAPFGMVKRTVAKYESIVANSARGM
jgi:Tfp pilus assembly protein FimT